MQDDIKLVQVMILEEFLNRDKNEFNFVADWDQLRTFTIYTHFEAGN